MAFGTPGIIGSWATNTKTAGSTLVSLQATSTVVVGKLVVVEVACDNVSTVDGDPNEITSVTDTPGNTYTKLGEYCNGQGAAAAGVTTALFYTIVTAEITASSSHFLTANFSSSRNAKVIHCFQVTIGSGVTIASADQQSIAVDGAVLSGLTLSGLTSREYLFTIAAGAEQTAIGNITNYSIFNHGTTGGSAVSNIAVGLFYRILTATGDTPGSTATSADYAAMYFALYEVAAVTLNPRPIQVIRQAVNRASRF